MRIESEITVGWILHRIQQMKMSVKCPKSNYTRGMYTSIDWIESIILEKEPNPIPEKKSWWRKFKCSLK